MQYTPLRRRVLPKAKRETRVSLVPRYRLPQQQRQLGHGCKNLRKQPLRRPTLFEAFDQIKAITDHTPKEVYVYRGYRAAYLGQQTDVIITG